MVDDRPEDGAAAEPGRPRREPPTIDLQATEISEAPKAEAKAAEKVEEKPAGQTGHAAAEPVQEEAQAAAPSPSQPVSQPVSPWAIAPISGAVAAALVIGVGWVLGWPAVQAPAPAPQLNAAAIDDLTARIAGLESKTSKPAAPVADPAAASRMEGIEKSVAALRSDLAATRTQLASAVNEIKSLPRDGSAPAAAPVDLAPLEERLAQIERAAKAQETQIAAIKAAEAKSAEAKAAEAKAAEAKPADDPLLRRVVAASLLDVAVRHGDPFVGPLAAAKPLAQNADALKPLDAFAASGVPNVAALCRELIAIVSKLTPPEAQTETTGSSGIVDRLQAGAAKLVRIQRADATGTDRASVVARVTAAALRNDLNDARRELNALPPADRGAAQAWLDRADARDAALAASRKFAADAMAALATPK
ncbi:MAG: hypothetical protein DI543_01230 [Bradyrhizobium icense]|nr:MAG: hypothetical protein DI543_01230 [Bradyrhizobium icense]